MEIAVIDDELKEVIILEKYFKLLSSEINCPIRVKSFTSGTDFLHTVTLFDLVCLDIDIQDQNGITIAKKLRARDTKVFIVFVTNLAQMAIKGYEVHAFDFIVKPVDYFSFKLKMQVALGIIKNKQSKNICIKNSECIKKIYTNNLYYIEVINHYTYFHTFDGIYKNKCSLKEIEKELKGLSFEKCNNCYLVNLKYVDSITNNAVNICGTWLKISRSKKKDFLQAINHYLGGLNE